MAEFADLAWGTAEVRRHLDNVIETAAESLSPTVVLETFKGLIHARPDVGSLRTDNEFLSRFLKARKMNTNDAFELYENYYRFVRRNSQLYNDRYNVHNSEIRQAIEDGLPGVLQRRDSRGRRVMVLFAAQWDPNRYSLSAVQKAFFISLDLLLRDCGVQEKGIVLIIDWSQFSLGQCRKLQLTVLKSIIEGLEYCYPVRFKSIHCVGQPWYVDAALSLLKPFLRETSRARIHNHGNNLASLHKFLPRENLPTELGGEGPYQSSTWIDSLIAAGTETTDALADL